MNRRQVLHITAVTATETNLSAPTPRAAWEGGTLIAHTIGLRDSTWLDRKSSSPTQKTPNPS